MAAQNWWEEVEEAESNVAPIEEETPWWESVEEVEQATTPVASQARQPEPVEIPQDGETEKPWYEQVEEVEAAVPTFQIPSLTTPEPEDGLIRQAADLPVQFAIGINNSIKGLTDLFGADNPVSQNLSQNVDWYRSLLSASAQQDEEEVGRILQEAEGKGMLDQLAAGLEAFTVAPADFVASGLGSLAVFAAGGLVGRAVGLGARGVQAVQAGLGAGMGAGIAKGEIYQSVKDEMLARGKTEEEARQVAMEAQSFGGKNLDQILVAAGLGAASAATGAEKIISKVLTKGGLDATATRVGNILKTGLTEAVPEFAQAAQEKFASNLARQREGADVSLTQGIFSQGALEGLVGLGLGMGAGAIEPRIQRPTTEPPTKEQVSAAAAESQDVARQNKDVAPATASLVEGQAEQIVQTQETPEQRVARLQEEATAAVGIELEEEPEVGVEPTVPVTPPVEPTPEGAVAPVEPVVEPAVAESPVVETKAENPVVETEQKSQEQTNTVKVFRGVAEAGNIPDGGAFFTDSEKDASAYAQLAALRKAVDENEQLSEIVGEIMSEEGAESITDLSISTVKNIIEGNKIEVGNISEGTVLRGNINLGNTLNLESFGSEVGNLPETWNEMNELGLVPETWESLDEDVQAELQDKYRNKAFYSLLEGEVNLNEQFNKGIDTIVFTDQNTEGKGTHRTYLTKAAEQFTQEAAPAVTPPAEVAPEVTPTPEAPNLEPLRRVARAEQAPEDVPSLVEAGLVEVYKDQPVITEAGLAALPEAERPRLTPQARKIQIDTGSNEVVAEAISKNLRIGVDQVGPNVRMPAGWTLVEDIYVPPAPQEVAPEAITPTVEPITPEKQVIPEQQEQVAPVVRVEQEQVNQGKPDVAKIINQFTVLERAAVAGKLLEEGYIDGRTADKFVKEATSDKTGGFSMAQIRDAQASADEKFNQQIAAARTSQPVAGEVSPAAVDLAAEDATRSTKERTRPATALRPKTILGKTAREALSYLSSLNLIESRDLDAESGIARWRQDPNIPKPFYAQIQDAAAILSKLPLRILDADKIISNADRGYKGGAKRFGDGDIGIPLTETARVQTATGSWVRRSVPKPLNVATLVHEVGHTLTADAIDKYISSKKPKGDDYLKLLDSALKNKTTPQPIKDLIALYKTTISQLGLEQEYFGKKGLAGGRARDSQRKAYDKKIVNNLTGNPFTWSQYYGLANIDEFVAQTWSSQSFQDLLKQIKAPDQQSLWTKFTKIIRDLFGFPSDSMASAVIDVSMQIAELETPIGARKGVAFSGVTIADRIAGRGEEPAPPTRNIWQAPEQEITSQETSINEKKIPAVFNQVKEWKEGTVNADIGGGRFDNVTDWLRDRGVENLIIDWFNRDRAFNEKNINRVRGGRADTATVSNVLNVIQEPEARDLVISQAADAIKPDGTAYFYIYEGKGDGVGRQTTKGWQENRKTQTYIDEISQHFENVERRNQMIVATGPIKEIGFAEAEPEMPSEGIPTFSEGSPEASTLSNMKASMAKVDAASEAKPNPENKPTYKISEIASVWMDQGGDARQLQDLITENTNLTPANAKRVANAIAKQYDIQQSIASAFIETQTGLSVEALPEGVTLPKEVDPDRPRPVMQRLFDVFMGVRVKPVKITVNEKTALNQQIRLKAAATREAKKAQQETANEVVEIIKAMELRGPVRPKQAQALAKRAAKVIWTSEKSIESFTDYAAKVVENTNYDADLRAARDAQKRAKALSTQKKVALSPQREVLSDISKIAVNRIEDPRMFAEMVNYYLRGFKKAISPDYVVVPDAEIQGYLSSVKDEEIQSQRELDRAVNLRLAEKYGVDPEEVNEVLAAFDVIKEIEASENREAIDNLLTEKAIETRDGLRAYDSIQLRQDQRKVVDAMAKVDPAALDAEERQRFIRIANNVIFNNQTNGAEYFMSVANGQQNARKSAQDSEMIARNKAWVNLIKTFGSTKLEKVTRSWALELQSVSDTFRNAFGKNSMAKIYDLMGMLDLNSSFTQANNTVDQIQEEMAEFHNKLEKDYGAASRNQDGILAEGVVGFLIQRVPKKGEADSIAQRRDLIRQDIANRRASNEGDRVAMADRIEAILNQIDGASTQEILGKLKQTYPANHESLVWYKDTLLPKYKDFLKNFDENFNDQANNYDNPDYLPIAFTSAGPSLAITKEEEQVFYDQVSLTPKQSANTIKRVDYTKIPKDRTTDKPKEISYNLRRNAFNSLSDQINKAYTSGAWQQIASFMKTPESTQVFGGDANKDFFIERLNRLRLSRMRRGAMSRGAFEKAADAIGVISRKLGTGIALGGVYQWIKQPPDQLITAWGSGARGEVLARNIAPSNQKAARNLLNKFSIGRRGDASAGYKYINQMEGHQNRLERYFSESKWEQAKEQAGKIADVWMIGLKKSDFIAASAAWMTYYETELNKKNIQIEDWSKEADLIDGDRDRREAAAYAEQMTDIYQGSSDPTQMAVFAQSGKSGAENLLKAMFVPFNSFAVQQRMRLYSDMRDVLNGEKTGRGGLAGTIGGLILFHATKRYVLPVISGSAIGVLYSLMGVDVEEPDEDKQKEQASKNFRQFLADASSNLLVGGTPQVIESQMIKAFNYAAYLTAMQLEDESVMGDDGELISFDKYQKERSPLYRYQTYGGAMSLGMLEIGFDQAKQVALNTKMLASPEEMENFTPEEKRLLYFSALSDWLYLMRLNDTDFARMVQKARRDMIKAAEEREKELARIRAGR
jgi:hypothetical protein